jgi:hypothetical protein
MLRSITPKRATTSLAASVDPTDARRERGECVIHTLDVRRFLEVTGVPEGAPGVGQLARRHRSQQPLVLRHPGWRGGELKVADRGGDLRQALVQVGPALKVNATSHQL